MSVVRFATLALFALSQVSGLPAALAQPVGPEFQVNTYTTGTQVGPAVAADAAGNFVVAWMSDGSAGSDTSLFSIQAQRYDAAGTPVPRDLLLTKPEQGETEKHQDELSRQKTEDSD